MAAAHSVQTKGARSRAEAEISAIAAALESYKADNGDYPTNGSVGSITPYSQNLVAALMPTNGSKVYFEFKSKYTNSQGYIDPFGTNYNYNYDAVQGAANNGTNNYDLWSTAGGSANSSTWIKNW